jgi:hypothetical protein
MPVASCARLVAESRAFPKPVWPSLLTPGRSPTVLLRSDWVALAVVYAVAVAVRWSIVESHPYTAEAAHYVVAQRLWMPIPGGITSYNDWQVDFSFLFWQRPMFSLLLAPGAWMGFTAYRVEHLALSCLLPVLSVVLLRTLGTRRWLAWPAGVVLAVHPILVPWGVLVLPDSLMAVLCLTGLLAAHHGRTLWMSAFLLAACWTKEVAVVTVLPLLAFAWMQEPDGTKPRLWPLQLGRTVTTLAAVAALAFVPLLVSLSRPEARFPGWGVGGDGRLVIERAYLLIWLAPVAFLALAWPTSRRLAVVALAWSTFFIAYRYAGGRAVEAWYVILPGTLTLLAATAGLNAAWDAAAGRSRRWVVPVTAMALAALLAVQVWAPNTNATQTALVTPLSHNGQWSLAQARGYESVRGDELAQVVDALAPSDGRLLSIDVDWSFVLYPLQAHGRDVVILDGNLAAFWHMAAAPVARDIEVGVDAVIVHKDGNPFGEAAREVYSDCLVLENAEYALLRAEGCQGRTDAFVEAVARQM